MRLPLWAQVLCSLCALAVPAGVGVAVGAHWGAEEVLRGRLQRELAGQRAELERVRREAQRRTRGLALRVAELQARMVRLDALGERLLGEAGLAEEASSWARPPAVGGPFAPVGRADLAVYIGELERLLHRRERELKSLEALWLDRRVARQSAVGGRPVARGFLSSAFGERIDPFTGEPAWHGGLDFAGPPGAPVVAVGPGVVRFAGAQPGYGNLVEIDHGGGLVTRYAHAERLAVEAGDWVRRGQVIATLGATGRATGPHLHFEVYEHGRAVDPALYVRKTLR
ncbi:MAG: peptidase [Porticoccaceae bacterium]|nr:MAG: peptidase [Porticoccaceae bacterium]